LALGKSRPRPQRHYSALSKPVAKELDRLLARARTRITATHEIIFQKVHLLGQFQRNNTVRAVP
jgi:hypothetical protein